MRSFFFLEENHRFPRLQRIWRLPSNYEIVKAFDMRHERVRETDFPWVYAFKKDGEPNLKKNSQHKLVSRRLPKIKDVDLKDADTLIKKVSIIVI